MPTRPYKCMSPTCREQGRNNPTIHLDPKDPNKKCPCCGTIRVQHFVKVAIIHLLIPKENGPLKEMDEDWDYGCERSQKDPSARRHLTKFRPACTCEECLKNNPPSEDEGETPSPPENSLVIATE